MSAVCVWFIYHHENKQEKRIGTRKHHTKLNYIYPFKKIRKCKNSIILYHKYDAYYNGIPPVFHWSEKTDSPAPKLTPLVKTLVRILKKTPQKTKLYIYFKKILYHKYYAYYKVTNLHQKDLHI